MHHLAALRCSRAVAVIQTILKRKESSFECHLYQIIGIPVGDFRFPGKVRKSKERKLKNKLRQ